MYTSNIIKGRTCKDWGTVYDKSSEALLRFRNDTQRDGNEDDTVEMDNIQNRKYGEDGTLITFKKKVQINRDDNEDKNEDDVQDENANETPSVEDDTTIDHKDLENENGINEVTTTKNIIIVTHLTSVRSVCGGGGVTKEVYMAKILKDVNSVLTNMNVDDVERMLTKQTVNIVFLTQLPYSIFFCLFSILSHK